MRVRTRVHTRRAVVQSAGISSQAFVWLLVTFLPVVKATAQVPLQREPGTRSTIAAASESVGLPDAPLPAFSTAQSDAAASAVPQAAGSNGPRDQPRTVHTGRFDNLIDPEEIAPGLTAGDKLGMGLKGAVSPFAVLGWITSATYSEAFNRSPNYGQSAPEYAQRLGAAAARASSDSIFSTGVMASILHEDPRYFVEGGGYSGVHRTLYALSRVVITKKDDGQTTVNYALLSGNAIGAGLTQTYYPAGNRNFSQTFTTFGVSLAGSGVKYLLEEFFYKQASIAQLKKRF